MSRMRSKSIVTINFNDVLCRNARDSFRAASQRWGASYVELTPDTAPQGASPHALKFRAFELCDADRVVFIDGADTLIRADAPSPFDVCPPDRFGGVTNTVERFPIFFELIEQEVHDWCVINRGLGRQLAKPDWFINSGVFVASRRAHEPVLHRASAIVREMDQAAGELRWRDQTLLNYALAELETPVLLLDETWNYMHPEQIGHWREMERYVYHFAGSAERRTVLPELDWRRVPSPAGQRGPLWYVRSLFSSAFGAGSGTSDLRGDARCGATEKPVVDDEKARARRLAFQLTREAATREGAAPITSPEQLPKLRAGSRVVTQDQMMTPEFLFWTKRLREAPSWQRRLWEYCAICQALWEHGMLRAGRRGLGLGPSPSSLTALLSEFGCELVVCDPRRTDDAQSLSHAFDFIWSSSTMERQGSIRKGCEFLASTCAWLRPGGVAVHVTEYNVSSDEDTIADGDVVVFRKRDVLAMRDLVAAAGCRMDGPDFDPGDGPLDRFEDRPPYSMPHLKLRLGSHVITSIALVLEKPAATSAALQRIPGIP